MKTKGMLLYTAMMMLSVNMFAQQGAQTDPATRAKMQADRLKTELTLTDAQYDQVLAVTKKSAEKMAQLREQNSGDRAALQTERRKMALENEEEFKKILTAEQWTTYIAWKEKRQSEMKGKGKKRRSNT